MAKTRKVINAKDLNTNKLVYFNGHAKATYMSDGSTVEDAINNINMNLGNCAYPLIAYTVDELESTTTILPNKFYLISNTDTSDGSVNNLSIVFGAEIEGVVNEYIFQFTSGSDMTFSLHDSVMWVNEEIPIIEPGYTYQISIVNNCATYLKFKKS